MSPPVEANDVCLFCEQSNFDHAHNCPARYDKTKLAFPDADPSPAGQREAARKFKADMKWSAQMVAGNLRTELGLEFMEKIGLALLVSIGKATLAQTLEFQRLTQAGEYTVEKMRLGTSRA